MQESNLSCPHCSQANRTSATFCDRCGAPLQLQVSPPLTLTAKKKKWPYIICGLLVLGIIGNLVDKGDKQKAGDSAAAIATSPTPTLIADNAPPAGKLAKAKEMSKADASGSDLQGAISILQSIPAEVKEYKEAQPLIKQDQEKLAKSKSEESLLGPKPENSTYDGTVEAVDRYLRNTLNDYDSAEYMEWSPVIRMDLKGQPYWAVRLKLRAKNAFGAKIIKQVIFFIRQNQVVNVIGL